MNGARKATVIAVTTGVLALAGLAVHLLRSSEPARSPWNRTLVTSTRWTRSVILFFGDPANPTLVAEPREILQEGAVEEGVSRVVRELIRGSQAGNVSLLNPQCRLRSVFVGPDQRLLLDFEGSPFPAHAGEVTRWLALESLVRVIHESFDQFATLTLLSNGVPISSSEKRLAIPDKISLASTVQSVGPS